MKAILEFNLPEDEEQFDAANRGMDWALVVWDLDQLLRNKLKYEEHVTDIRKTLEEVREVLYDLMDVKNLTFPK